jgi:carbonic anhydrase
MAGLEHLFERNQEWARTMVERDPDFFRRLSGVQSPRYLWIGCSDSRVPANEIVGLLPGELFVHRNVANVVVHTDLNCLSVIQFAVEALGVQHIIVCGHYGCGGVLAALEPGRRGLIDNWLRHVEDVRTTHADVFWGLPQAEWPDALCELNVVEQVRNVCRTSIVSDAWRDERDLTVHGWVYGLRDGIARDLGVSVSGPGLIDDAVRRALDRVRERAVAPGTPATG